MLVVYRNGTFFAIKGCFHIGICLDSRLKMPVGGPLVDVPGQLDVQRWNDDMGWKESYN